jgi:hypothetical protein
MTEVGGQIPSPEPTPKRRWLSLGRRSGEMAVAQAVETDWQLDEEIELFGLEPALIEYQGLWSEHGRVISSFVDDPSSAELINAAYGENRDITNRQQRQGALRFQERHFAPLAAAFITNGKIQASKKENAFDAMEEDATLHKAAHQGLQAYQEADRLDAKLKSLFVDAPPADSVKRLLGRLDKLQDDSAKTYRPIVKQEQKMSKALNKEIKNNPHRALQLVEVFLETSDSESAAEKTFASFLANGYTMYGDKSLLSVALDSVETAAEEGIFAEHYIEQLFAQEGSTMAFVAEMLTHEGLGDSFKELLAKYKTDWPAELSEGYEQFYQGFITAQRLKLKQASERAFKKAWLHPDLDAHDDALDRLLVQLNRSDIKARTKHLAKPKRQKATFRSSQHKAAPADYLVVDKEEDREPRKLKVVSRTEDGLSTAEVANIDTLLERVLEPAQLRDNILVDGWRRVIERLRIDPLGIGVRSLHDVSINLGGRKTKVYRANPAILPGVSVPRQVKDSRIVFIVTNGDLNIMGIPKNHNDYDRLVKSLLRR